MGFRESLLQALFGLLKLDRRSLFYPLFDAALPGPLTRLTRTFVCFSQAGSQGSRRVMPEIRALP